MRLHHWITVSVSITCLAAIPSPVSAQVERIWLTHRTSDPSKVVVNWTTKAPGESNVRFGPTKDYGQDARAAGSTTLHHVEIPLPKNGEVHYSVSTGDQASDDAVIRGYPTDLL